MNKKLNADELLKDTYSLYGSVYTITIQIEKKCIELMEKWINKDQPISSFLDLVTYVKTNEEALIQWTKIKEKIELDDNFNDFILFFTNLKPIIPYENLKKYCIQSVKIYNKLYDFN